MKSIDFEVLVDEYKSKFDQNLYGIEHPKIDIPDDLGQQLMDKLYISLMGEEMYEKTYKISSYNTWAQKNTGQTFNFWHFVSELMEPTMVTTDGYHYGKCVINRTMKIADPPAHQFILSPYCAEGPEFTKPVINNILDMYQIDELEITASISR